MPWLLPGNQTVGLEMERQVSAICITSFGVALNRILITDLESSAERKNQANHFTWFFLNEAVKFKLDENIYRFSEYLSFNHHHHRVLADAASREIVFFTDRIFVFKAILDQDRSCFVIDTDHRLFSKWQ